MFGEWYKLYESFFPARPAQVEFLRHWLEPAWNSVPSGLDVACGTGAYTRALAKQGVAMVGVDLDDAMVAGAREKAAQETSCWTSAGAPVFLTGDMTLLPEVVGERGFDLVFCIGNSLPIGATSPPTAPELLARTRSMAHMVRTGGHLVIQTVNFDRVLPELSAKRELQLAPLKSGAATLQRAYRLQIDGSVDFRVTVKGPGLPPDGMELASRLHPLTAEQLSGMIRDSGLRVQEKFGDFSGAPSWTHTSPATILVAAKD